MIWNNWIKHLSQTLAMLVKFSFIPIIPLTLYAIAPLLNFSLCSVWTHSESHGSWAWVCGIVDFHTCSPEFKMMSYIFLVFSWRRSLSNTHLLIGHFLSRWMTADDTGTYTVDPQKKKTGFDLFLYLDWRYYW